MLCACAKAHEDAALRAMDEANNLEGVTVRSFVYLELKPDESIDQPSRELEPRKRTTVDEKLWGSRSFGVNVRSCGYEVDGTPRGSDPLPIEYKVV